jgi:nucleotidyltransferase/DNA polymerase involved in DNA repair
MNEKPVTDLAGIGEVLGKRLEAKGFDKVSAVTLYPMVLCVLSTAFLCPL